MKYRRLATLVFASACLLVRAQDDDDRNKKPPTEIPDFSNLDEYIYEPKSSVQMSFRHLGGAKTSFFGTGSILPPEAALPGDGPNLTRVYHDGQVDPDARTATRTDTGGNPILDPVNNSGVAEPVPGDGRTNTWSYNNASQVNNAGENPSVPLGFIAFHSYSAEVFADKLDQSGKSTNGMDLAVTRDMGKLFGGRVSWSLIAGMSVNDIEAKNEGAVKADVTTLTDYYNTYGQTIPAAPYTAPASNSQVVTDSQGNVLTINVDSSVLIGNQPAYRDLTTQKGLVAAVVNTWKLKGAYYTFRAGPMISIPIGTKFHVDISAGPALVYSGTTYRVTSTFDPLDPEVAGAGDPITEVDSRAAYKFRVGAYADASVAYDLTDKAGFFAGAVWQTAGSYTQSLATTTARYAAKVDLENQNGLRAGMSVKF